MKSSRRSGELRRSPLRGEGLRFACQGCGACCKARGPYGYVYLTLADRRCLAAHLGLATSLFTRRYCERSDGELHLKHPELDCTFFDGQGCTVYLARPEQCRTWPFWPENRRLSVWREVVQTCSGVGRGRFFAAAEIQAILASQEDS